MADIRERDVIGTAKYGQRLTVGDGRNSLVDAYQESLDLVVYLRKAIEEKAAAEERAFLCGASWCARQIEMFMAIRNDDPESARTVYGLWNGNREAIPFDPEKDDPSELYDNIVEFLHSEAAHWRESAPRWARVNLDQQQKATA